MLAAIGLQAAESSATLSFASDAQRNSFSTTQQIWEQNGIIFTHKKGTGNNIVNNTNPIRCYANSEIIIDFEQPMTKLEFSCASSSYAAVFKNSIASGATVTTSGSVATITLSTPSKTFTISKLSAQTRVNSLTVYYEVDSDLVNPEISWSGEDSYSVVLGEEFKSPTLNNPNGLAVSYESSNASVATIDLEGNVSIVGAGNTVISATFDGDETYKASTVSYELNVIALGAITANGSEDTEFSVYVNSEVVFSAENAESISYTVNGGNADVANSWTPEEVGSYTVEVTATLSSTIKRQTFNITVEAAPAVQTVTFVFADLYTADTKVEEKTIEPVTISGDKGSHQNSAPTYYVNGTNFRAYAGNTVAFSVPETYLITKIESTFSSSSYNGGTMTADSGFFSSSNTVWNTDGVGTSKVVFTIGDKQARWTKIVVTYVPVGSEDTRKEVTLAFLEESYSITFGDEFTNPTLTVDPVAAATEVKYSSSNTEVATVDPTTGEVTVHAVGNVAITAAIKDSETYKDASASYTLKVNAPMETVATLTEFIAAAPTTDTKIEGPVTVFYQSSDKKYTYITDGTSNLLVYGALTNTYQNGDVLTGIVGTFTIYGGLEEMVPNVDYFGVASAGTSIEPNDATLDKEFTNSDFVVFSDISIINMSGKDFTLTDGVNEYAGYNQFGVNLSEMEYATVVAIANTYKTTTKQFYIVSVTEKLELGEIMFNDIVLDVDHQCGASVGETVTISAANAESMGYTVDAGTAVEVEGSSFTWTSTEVGTYSFSVWAELGSNRKEVSFTVTVSERTIQATLIRDVLTQSDFGVSDTSYNDVTYTSEECGLTYTANMAGDHNSIQLRSKNSDSGIVVSANKYGLLAQAATIKWNSNTSSTRTLSFYGQQNAFTDASELYDTEAAKLGEKCIDDGAEQTLSFSTEFHYIGLRSKSGAQYIDEIELVWTLPEPKVYINQVDAPSYIETLPVTLEFATVEEEETKVYYKFIEDGVATAEAASGYTEVPEDGYLEIKTNGELKYYAEVNGWTSNLSTIKFADTTAIVEIESSEAAEAQWYDLNGRRVAAPGKGIYILKQGNKATKYAF